MWVGLLGPLQLRCGGEPVEIGGLRLRGLLARLAVDAGRVVPLESLVEAVWPESTPENPAHALQSLVARLRRALPDRSALRSVPRGYLLALRPEQVDVLHFEELAAEGRRSAAVETLRAALELWRGEPFSDVPAAPYVAAEVVRLDELRLGAIEDRIAAEIALGDHRSDVVAELDSLTTAHPLRERLRALLLEALGRQGRRAEALAAYEEYRTRLAAELGSDPGSELQELHLDLLRDRRPEPRPALPAELTSFVGRVEECSAVAERFQHGRLVTLVGPGGVGKTRLATAVAGRLTGVVRLVELARVTAPADVPYAIAVALGVRGAGGSNDVVAQVVEAVAATKSVLVLDNCEHVVDAAAEVAHELLRRCPRLRVLATSREPLGITGEVLIPVRPLDPEAAVRLFTDRARAARPDFTATDEVAAVCRRLDGLPLAIELAAARLRSMSLSHLVARLDDRFRVLTGGSRTALPRHRTLRAVVAWSWELLTEEERDAVERLAVFAGGFGPDEAARVGIAEEVVDSLVDKSLLQLSGERYRLLDTIRAYGEERLRETGRLDSAREQHAACFLDLAERARRHLRGPAQVHWVRRLAADRDNLTAALRHASADTAVRLGSVLGHFWLIRGDHAEAVQRLGEVVRAGTPAPVVVAGHLLNAMFAGMLAEVSADVERQWQPDQPEGAFVDALLALARGDFAAGLAATEPHLDHPDPWARAMFRLARAFLRGSTSDLPNGVEDLRAAAEDFATAGDSWGRALSLMSLASAHTAAGSAEAAIAALDESTALTRELGDDGQRVWLANIRISAGDAPTARAELLAVVAEARSAHHVALARLALADLARHSGDLDQAADQLRRAEEDAAPDSRPFQVLHLSTAGFLAAAKGELDSAEAKLCSALSMAATMPDAPMAAAVGVGKADLFLRRGQPRRAAAILGAACVVRGGPDAHDPDVVRLTRDLQQELGPWAYRAAYAEGRELSAARALELLES
ncbi:BTAD domain-containing putative transcriptional regulator [Saccharopolyspora sp. NPDC000359]|uniref:BTAD domain-containing putative transcriptional regulator n=1 Tax=Saccharopolyspora sp. NPDC000359 TaxID=3154251 RepID=UPI00332AA734